jgi:hypothetical protein
VKTLADGLIYGIMIAVLYGVFNLVYTGLEVTFTNVDNRILFGITVYLAGLFLASIGNSNE